MSIETLLEAARFLEWQAQQQQITRDESEYTEKMLLNRGTEQRCAEVAAQVPPVRVNHVTWEEGSRLAHHPAMVPPPLVLPPVPITVVPIPMASGQTSALPITSGLAPRLSPAEKDSNSPLPQQRPLLAQMKMEPISPLDSVDTTQQQQQQQQLQLHPTSIVATAQHTLHTGPTLLQSPPGPIPQLGPVLDDPRHPDMRRRPGGAGTREVHNKLEKNRRAHLKECFETLKRNIPNVDEKKTSNLSVLRSAIRYIQTLKRKEKEYEHEMERLAREKISTQQRLTELKNELSQWVDVLEIERVLRQTVQPEDDQASTSTASEGEDNVEQDLLLPHSSLPKIPPQPQPEVRPPALAPQLLPSHVSIQHRPKPGALPHTLAPLQSHLVAQPTVISHASVSHASVIQAVSHVIQAGPKHIGHIAPSATSATSGGPAQPIGHITVHPVAHLGHPLPGLYPQTVAVTQPATVVGHLAHTLTHGQVNGVGLCQPAATALVGKQASVGTQVVTHHPQLVGQAVLNPVTMVTMPSFPVSTLKLA